MANFIHLLVGVILTLTFVVKNHAQCLDGDCSGHGKCVNVVNEVNETVCECDRGWGSHHNTADADTYCNYKQSSKKIAFLSSFFAGIFGADWFYLSRANVGYIIAGLLKLFLSFGCFGSWLYTYFGPELQNSESVKAKLRGANTFFTLVAFVWWVVDWARILANKFPDGNAALLMGW